MYPDLRFGSVTPILTGSSGVAATKLMRLTYLEFLSMCHVIQADTIDHLVARDRAEQLFA